MASRPKVVPRTSPDFREVSGLGAFIRARFLETYPSPKLMIVLLLVAVFGFAFIVVEESLLGAALSGGLAASLHASPGAESWIVASGALGTIAAYPLGGPLADRIGRTRLIAFGLLGYAVVDALKMVTTDVPLFIVLRVVSGAMGMLTVVPALAIVRDYTPRTSRGLGYGIATALGWGLGALLSFWIPSPILSAYAHTALFGLTGPWRWVFAFGALFALVFFVVELLFLKDVPPALRVRRRGLTVQSDKEALAVERAERGSVLQAIRLYISSWRMWLIWSNQWFWGLAWAGILTFFPVILVTTMGKSAGTATFLAGFVWVAYLVSSFFIGWLSDIVHVRKSFNMLGMLGVFVTMLIFATQLLYHSNVSTGTLLVVFVLVGIFAGMQYPSFAITLAGEAETVNPAGVASAFAFYSLSASAVGFFPGLIFPRLGAAPHGWETAVVVMAIGALCSAPTLLAARGRLLPSRVLPADAQESYY